MSFTKITSRVIAPGAVTAEALAPGVGGGPAIANVQIANSSYELIDDTAISLDGGYIIINGENFDANVQVLIGSNVATSVTYVSENQVRAEVGASAAGSKIVYLVNTDTGATAIRVNGLTYSGFPTWVTDSALPGGGVDELITIQLSATSDSNVSYSLADGSSLPEGLTLSANGLLSGTITGLEDDTLYNFTIEATDEELQNSPRTFSVTIAVSDEYFKQTVLLLNGDGTNGAQNNTFLDGSSNNFTITRNGNTTQGTFSPFSLAEGQWSNYFDGSGDYLAVPDNAAFDFGSGDFTTECWFNLGALISSNGAYTFVSQWRSTTSVSYGWFFYLFNNAGTYQLYLSYSTTGSNQFNLSVNLASAPAVGSWNHVAFVRSGTNFLIFLNGSQVGTTQTLNATLFNAETPVWIGAQSISGVTPDYVFNGYISNLRIVKGRAVYTSNFTPSTAPLGATSGGTNPPQGTETSLLTCQSNRFRDNSSNAFAITRNGDVRVTAFSPFKPAASYDPAVNGGSGYFDGSGDYLTFTNESAVQLTNSAAWTIEFWVYPTTTANQDWLLNYTQSGTFPGYGIGIFSNNIRFWDGNVWTNFGETIGNVINQWTHVAVTYEGSGSTRRMFINGKQFASAGAVNANINRTTTGDAYFGSTGTSSYVNGWMTGLRIVKGNAIWTADFTPPTTPPTSITNTSLLLNFTNGGITDATGRNNLETVGDARLDTSIKKYGTGSMKFDGSGDYLIMKDTPEMAFSSGDFTIEMWLYRSASNVQHDIIAFNPTSTNGAYPALYISSGNALFYYTNGANRITGGTINTGQWYHIALTRSGTSTRLFIDGTQSGSTYTDTNVYLCGANRPVIGSAGFNVTGTFNGYIDDLRITKGIARYTANFTAPTRAHRLK